MTRKDILKQQRDQLKKLGVKFKGVAESFEVRRQKAVKLKERVERERVTGMIDKNLGSAVKAAAKAKGKKELSAKEKARKKTKHWGDVHRLQFGRRDDSEATVTVSKREYKKMFGLDKWVKGSGPEKVQKKEYNQGFWRNKSSAKKAAKKKRKVHRR